MTSAVVIPAEAGIHGSVADDNGRCSWAPAFVGATGEQP